ncbi:MAG: ABC transporter permease subunit [Armatimonadetes bacterium]|nr:ABC transporter permease subunit [Armatimonadota bacterium]
MNFVELLAWSVWDLLRPRKLVTMLLVGLAGPAFAMLIRSVSGTDYAPNVAYGLSVPLAVYSFTMILLSVIFASGIVSAEMVGKTIPYLLTRPIPRWKILLAKWLAATLAVSIAVMASCALTAVITHGFAGLGSSPLQRDLIIIPVGVVSYCSLFTMLSVLSTKPWLFAISFGFLWESWIPFLPGDFKKLSIMSQLRALSPHSGTGPAPSGPMEILRLLSPENIEPSAAWNALIVINVVTLAIAAAVFSSGEFVPKDETT